MVPYTDRECHQEKIVYNLSKENQSNLAECLEHKQECLGTNYPVIGCVGGSRYVCIKYRFDCSVTINNLDDEGGVWKFKGVVFKEGPQQIDLKTLNSNLPNSELIMQQYVQPQSSESVSMAFNTAIPEPANLEVEKMYCVLSLISEPHKTICETVTKTRQECQTVTKYRRECQDVERTREIC